MAGICSLPVSLSSSLCPLSLSVLHRVFHFAAMTHTQRGTRFSPCVCGARVCERHVFSLISLPSVLLRRHSISESRDLVLRTRVGRACQKCLVLISLECPLGFYYLQKL